MDLSNFYIALVFLVPVALGFTLLSAMASDLDFAGLVAVKPKATSTAKRKVVTNRVKDDIGCYAAI
jgi:hypothetical protein